MNPRLKKINSILIATVAIDMLLLQSAIAQTSTPTINPQCQQIALPDNSELVNFESMRVRYSLENYSGMKIGTIHIVNLPVFDLNNPDENNTIYRFLNGIHSPTKNYVVRNQLLFEEGEVLTPRLIEESERILRSNSYLSDAIVLPYQDCGESLDVIVAVRDLWTMLPKFYISRKGGENEYGLTLEDTNFLGTGNSLFVQWVSERERDTGSIGFGTRHLFGTRITLDAVYQDSTDGFTKTLQIQQPFFALDTNWSYGVRLNEKLFEESLQELEQDITAFDHTYNDYQLFAGYSDGLIDGFTERYAFGFARTEDIFEPIDTTTIIPDDRILAYPWLQYSIIEDNFSVYKNLNVLYRTEDVPVGLEFSTTLGYADDSFDSELSQWVFSLNYSDFPVVLDRHLFKTDFQVTGFWDRDTKELVNTIGSIDLSYYWLKSIKQRLFVGLSYDHGKNLTADELLPLGGDKGLRGYPSEYLLGERRLLLNLEHRYFFDAHYLNLFRFAGVLFFDMGQTKNGANSITEDSELLTSTGMGIRINSSKTNISRIVHIDLAFPLQDRDVVGDYEFRVTANATF